uniref:Protein kinase domain-containing protein n=1 Tax=Anopheles maculatus TaxID=74869 RepID=A0A182S934_9DIPT
MLLLVISLTFIVILILIYMTCFRKKSSRKKLFFKNNVVHDDSHLSVEEILANVHQFQREKVQLVEKLEKGKYGVCWKAIVTEVAGDLSTEIQVMVKEAVDQYDRQTLLQELMSYVRVGHHVNVLSLLGIVTENIVTEHVTQHQIACGLQYLASRAFVYGNLSAHDVLLGEGNIVKLANFAVPRRINSSTKLTQKNVQSLERIAPECLEGEGTITASSDVWSYGVLLWELFALGSDPCWNMTTHDRLVDSFECDSSLPKPEYANDEVYQIMRRCWHQDALERPSFAELCYRLFCMIPSHYLR